MFYKLFFVILKLIITKFIIFATVNYFLRNNIWIGCVFENHCCRQKNLYIIFWLYRPFFLSCSIQYLKSQNFFISYSIFNHFFYNYHNSTFTITSIITLCYCKHLQASICPMFTFLLIFPQNAPTLFTLTA